MPSFFVFLLSIIFSSVFGGCASCASCSTQTPALDQLTLEQKIGQLFVIGFEGKQVTPELEEQIKDLHPGGVLLLGKNIESKEQLKKLTADLQEVAKADTGLPLFIAVDQEGGPITRLDFLKQKTAQSEIKTAQQAFDIGFQRGNGLKDLGINLNLAPLLDPVKPGDFIFERAFQKEPEIIGNLAKGLIRGQKQAGIFTAIKHFPGYQGIDFNPEEKLAKVAKLPETEQFVIAMEQEPDLVMTSNVVYKELDNLPFTFSKKGIDLLKQELGKDILVISDDLDQYSLLNNYELEEIVSKPLIAGVDILIFSGWRLPSEKGVKALISAVDKDKLKKSLIDKKIKKIIEIKSQLYE